MITRPRRTVPQRITQQRIAQQKARQETPVERARFRAEQVRTRKEFIDNVREESKQLLTQVNTIQDLDTQADRMINQNINDIPPELRQDFISTIREQQNEIKENQKKVLKQFEARRSEAQSRRRELISEGAEPKLRTMATAELRALNEITGELRKGNIIDVQKANEFISDKISEREQLERAVDRQIEARENVQRAVDFVSKEMEKGETPTIKRVRDKFNLTLEQASEVQRAFVRQKELQGTIEESIDKREIPSIQELTRFEIPESQAKDIQQEVRTILAETRPAEEVVREFSQNMFDAIKEKDIKTNITNIRQIESLIKDGVRKEDIDLWNNLSSRDRNIITSFVEIRELRDIAREQDLREYINQDKFFQKADVLYDILQRDLKYAMLPPRKEIQVVVKEKDKKNIDFVKNLSDKEILRKITTGEITKISEAVQSINNIYKRAEKRDEFLINDMIERLGKEAKKDGIGLDRLVDSLRYISGKETEMRTRGRPLRALVLNSLRIELQEIKKADGTISLQDYKRYLNSLQDITGIKESMRKRLNITKQDFQNFETHESIWRTALRLGKFVKRSAFATVEWFKSFAGLIKSMFNLVTLKPLREDLMRALVRDVVTMLDSRTFNKQKLFEETLKETQKHKDFFDTPKRIMENPELIVIGTALVIASGQKALRDTIVEKPEKLTGTVAGMLLLRTGLKKVLPKLGATKKVKLKKYLERIPDVNDQKATIEIFKVGEKIKRLTNVKIANFDFSILSDNKKLISVLGDILKRTKSVVYGSLVEYEAKLTVLQKTFSKALGKKLTKKQAFDIYVDRMMKHGFDRKTIIDDILMKPKDLDIIIRPSMMKKDIQTFLGRYRYLPATLKQMFPKLAKRFGVDRKIDFGLRAMRMDKKSVFSVLSEKQIDTLLKELVTDGMSESAMFKIKFLQNLYDQKAPISFLRNFEVTGAKMSLKGTDFAIDMHTSKDVAFTRTFLGMTFKQPLPFEKPVAVDFKPEILKNAKALTRMEQAKNKLFKDIARQFKTTFDRMGVKVNAQKLGENLERFLEKSEIMEKQTFDFLKTAKGKGFNKRILQSYYDALNLTDLGVSGIDLQNVITNEQNFRTFLKLILAMSKKTAPKLVKINQNIAQLEAERQIMVYFSTASKGALQNVLQNKMVAPNIKKILEQGKALTVKEQETLLKFFGKYDKVLQDMFKDISKFGKEKLSLIEKLSKAKTKEIVQFKEKQKFLDLVESVRRELEFIRGFETGKIQRTKDGIYFVSPKEQVQRRVAGAVSTIFEDRRAKDIKKLYGNAKFEESLLRLELAKPNPIERTIQTLITRIKQRADELDRVTRKFLTERFRLQKMITTKGVSETKGITHIDFLAKQKSTNTQEYVKALQREINNQLSKTANIPDNVWKQWTRDLIKIAQKRESPVVRELATAFGTAGSKLRTYLARTMSVAPTESMSRSISQSISKAPSVSVSTSTSKISSSSSAISSVSTSVSTSVSNSISSSGSSLSSVSKSVSKSVSQSVSQSVSPSISSSVSKSIISNPPPTLLPFLKPKWDNKIKQKNINYMVNGLVREKSSLREINLRTTKNRAIVYMARLVDNTTATEFGIKIIGFINKKDIQPPSLTKFKKSTSKNPLVLKYVELKKYRNDTAGERAGLTVTQFKRKKRGYKNVKKRG